MSLNSGVVFNSSRSLLSYLRISRNTALISVFTILSSKSGKNKNL